MRIGEGFFTITVGWPEREASMDRDEALRLLGGGEQGIEEWNRRRVNEEPIPSLARARLSTPLSNANLRGADLREANLEGTGLVNADLAGADLREAKLSKADLRQANLNGADLSDTRLREAQLSGAQLSATRLSLADLRGADLVSANLNGADLVSANLEGANLSGVNLKAAQLNGACLAWADLREANLASAVLTGADVREAKLEGADLESADLRYTNFSGADLIKANLRGAYCLRTVFAKVDLSAVKGLELVRHLGPCTIGIDTIFLSKGKIADSFLRGCGVPETLIEYLPALIQGMQPVQFYSCFISYSTKDEDFATRLYNDLRDAGIECWKWDDDARIGKSLWGEIDRAIHDFDKLILLASESSLKSPAVNREVERAIQEEDRRTILKQEGNHAGDTDVLFPVNLDGYIFRSWEHERKADVIKKVVANASGWESKPEAYAKVRDRLLRDLKKAGDQADEL